MSISLEALFAMQDNGSMIPEAGSSQFQLKRLGVIMEPEPGNALEAEGVLNPAAARGPDGELYLFPRLVGRGNYSRIGRARVCFDANGDPVKVERLGVALEPQAPYELRPGGGGGCEDPRITFVESVRRYVMTYTAFSAEGPRIALAVSEDLVHWERIGLAAFEPCDGLDFNGVDNKDALVFPAPIPDANGEPALAMLHRPLFPGTHPHQTVHEPAPRPVDIEKESIWISYCPATKIEQSPFRACRFHAHHRLASPVADWERLKIGGGTPPVLTKHGWLLLYHGVCETPESAPGRRHLRYAAGVLVLDSAHSLRIRYRSPKPLFAPELPLERTGLVDNVVFPTACDQRLDLGRPDWFDVYYGMADDRVGVARMEIPEQLPEQPRVDRSQAQV